MTIRETDSLELGRRVARLIAIENTSWQRFRAHVRWWLHENGPSTPWTRI